MYEVTDPIRMARRMGLLGVDLVFLTDGDLISSDDSVSVVIPLIARINLEGMQRILCFFRALSRMISYVSYFPFMSYY